MKLYTENQVREMLSVADDVVDGYKMSFNEVIDLFKPIELPSDEDIKNKMFRYNITDFGQMFAFQVGAKWVIDKIKNQQQ